MLKSVQIHNFSKISNFFLANLAQVNYLVGNSVSGKSSSLLAIYQQFSKQVLPSLELDFARKTGFKFEAKNLLNNQKPEVKLLFLNQNSLIITKSLQTFLIKNQVNSELNSFFEDLETSFDYYDWGFLNSNYTGYGSEQDRLNQIENNLESLIQKHFAAVNSSYSNQISKLILLEEPENYFHPSLTKQLPLLFKTLSQKYQVQFLIATNSPFLLLASGDLTEQEKVECECNKLDFSPSQKIYLLQNGINITKSGKSGVVDDGYILGSDGYWGKKVAFVASNILGSSLGDFIRPINQTLDVDANLLILCEGQGKDEDAKTYNQIFGARSPRSLFVSCKGNTQTAFSFEILEQIKNGLYANFQILMLRDRDHEFPKDSDMVEFRKNHTYRRVLVKRSIEAYIFASEIFAIWLKHRHVELSPSQFAELITIEKEIENSVHKAILGDFYKERYQTYFTKILQIHNQKHPTKAITFEEFKWQMVDLIKPKTKTYKELVKAVF